MLTFKKIFFKGLYMLIHRYIFLGSLLQVVMDCPIIRCITYETFKGSASTAYECMVPQGPSANKRAAEYHTESVCFQVQPLN